MRPTGHSGFGPRPALTSRSRTEALSTASRSPCSASRESSPESLPRSFRSAAKASAACSWSSRSSRESARSSGCWKFPAASGALAEASRSPSVPLVEQPADGFGLIVEDRDGHRFDSRVQSDLTSDPKEFRI